MDTALKTFLSLALAALAHCTAGAQTIQWLQDMRHISVTGFAQVLPEPGTNYFHAQAPGAAHEAFSGSASDSITVQGSTTNQFGGQNAAHARSDAFQQSSLGFDAASFSSQINAVTGGSPSGWEPDELTFAEALSLFEVRFQVSNPTPWHLTVSFSASGGGNHTIDWDLSSDLSGSILGAPTIASGYEYSGWLQPCDFYTLRFHINSSADTPAPFGESAFASMDSYFTAIPEPSVFSLGMTGLLTLLALRRRCA